MAILRSPKARLAGLKYLSKELPRKSVEEED